MEVQIFQFKGQRALRSLGSNWSTAKDAQLKFLAALSSSRRLFICPSVRQSNRPSVRRSIGPSVSPLVMFVKKWPLEYQKVIKTYLCTYLRDSSDGSDSSDSSESSNSCDRSDSNDSTDSSDQTSLYTKTLQELQNTALRSSHWLSNVSNCSF